MKKLILPLFVEISIVMTISILITIVWQGLEIIVYGTTTPRAVDEIVTAVLALSLYKNLNIKFSLKQ